MKEYQRTLNRSIRELERERGRLEQQEKKIILDIKKAAKENQLVRYWSVKSDQVIVMGMSISRRILQKSWLVI